MPTGRNILGKPIDEEKWSRAKEKAAEEGHGSEYDYIMDIYKKMTHSGEFAKEHVAERKKTGEKVPEWKNRRWDSKQHQVKEPVKKSVDHMMLMVFPEKEALQEFRCGHCGSLLFKGKDLEKSLIEVKCRSCKKLLVSPGMFMLQ